MTTTRRPSSKERFPGAGRQIVWSLQSRINVHSEAGTLDRSLMARRDMSKSNTSIQEAVVRKRIAATWKQRTVRAREHLDGNEAFWRRLQHLSTDRHTLISQVLCFFL